MILTHGPYIALVGDSQPDDLMHGHVVNMQADGLRFAGRDFEELKKAFTNAVDDYTARCRERGVEPEEPSKIQLTSRYTLDQALIYAQQDWSYAATLAYYSTGEIDRLTDDPEIAEPFG